MNVKGKKILIGVTGSIAAYKIPLLVRLLIKSGAEVKVVMTPSSSSFVSPLVLSTLSKNEVVMDIVNNLSWSNHVMLGRWADLMVIAPASANTIAKMAHGICDNMLLATYLSATCRVLLAPAMDEDMYQHPVLKDNIKTLESQNIGIIPATHGELASGLIGEGRMAEPEEIASVIYKNLGGKTELHSKQVMITAGPTYEAIDPVRFIGNRSSGKMGMEIAKAFAEHGSHVHLILGPSRLEVHHPNITLYRVETANEMYQKAIEIFPQVHIAVMSAAVADYTPKTQEKEKIKKGEGDLKLELVRTKDILKSLGSQKKEKQILVGFALESQNERQNALKKLKEKNADMIILNSIRDEGAGFGGDRNKITIFDQKGNEDSFDLKSKKEVAKDIVAKIISMI